MTEEIARLQVRLEATTAKLDSAVDRSRRQLRRNARGMERTAKRLDNRLSSVGAGFASALPARAAAGAAAIAAIGVAVRKVISEGDRMRQIEGRFKALTGDADRARALVTGMLESIRQTGAEIDGTAASIARFRIAGDAIGATDQQVIQFTENFQKLGRIGGATTEAMSNAALQLSQGLSAGVVRAEEFNSIIENTPLVATSIAKAMGLSVGELRAMVVEGELLSKDVFAALLSQSEEINKAFMELPENISVATGRLQGELAATAAMIDENIGLSQTWASIINWIADDLRSIRVGQSVQEIERYRKALKSVQDQIAAQAMSGGAINPILRDQEQRLSALLQGAVASAEGKGHVEITGAAQPSGTTSAIPKKASTSGGSSRRRTDPTERAADRYRDLAKAIAEEAAATEFAIGLIGVEASERERLTAQREHDLRMIEIYDRAREAGARISDEEVAGLVAISEELAALEVQRASQVELLKEQEAAARQSARATESFTNSLGNALSQARDFNDVMKSLAVTLAQEALRGIFTGEGVLSGLSGVFSGAFATGGRPAAGRPAIVGERGPEVFVPDSPGRVLSHADAMAAARSGGGGGSPQVVQTINLSPGVDATTIAMVEARLLPQVRDIAVGSIADARRRGGAISRAL